MGISRGMRTVLMVPPSLEFYSLTFALFKLGAIVVLMMAPHLFCFHPAGTAFSLEHDVVPRAIEQRACYGFRVAGPLVDIGTPERYRAAQALLSQVTKMPR